MQIKRFLSQLKEKLSPKTTCYAIKYSANGETISHALISVLGKGEVLGWWNFGKISQITAYYNKKTLAFAIKDFSSEKDSFHAISNYNLLKQAKIPTWTTYRLLQKKGNTSSNRIIMTLGSGKNIRCFSPHNYSKDREKIKKDAALDNLKNLDHFFEQAFDCISKAGLYRILLPWDSYMFTMKNSDEISLLVWDLDLIKKIKEVDSDEIFRKNIRHFLCMLFDLKFHVWPSRIEDFAFFLEKEKDIDIWDIVQDVTESWSPWMWSCN